MNVCQHCGGELPVEEYGRCPHCGLYGWPGTVEDHEEHLAWLAESEEPKPQSKSKSSGLPCPNVIGDAVRPYYCHQLGAQITSKSQRERIAAEKGCIVTSASEYFRREGKPHIGRDGKVRASSDGTHMI